MSSYFNINIEQELRTLNSAILNVRKWLRKQHQIIKHLTGDEDNNEGNHLFDSENLLKKLVAEAKRQQVGVDNLLNRGQNFLLEHANLVLEVDLENLVFLWNSYVKRLHEIHLEPGSANLNPYSENILANKSTFQQEGCGDKSQSVVCDNRESETGSASNEGQISVDDKPVSTCVNEADVFWDSSYDLCFESSDHLTYEDLETISTSVDTGESSDNFRVEKRGFDSLDNFVFEPESGLAQEFSYNAENGGMSTNTLEDSSEDEDVCDLAASSGVIASYLPVCTEKMEKPEKILNMDTKDGSCHGSVLVKKAHHCSQSSAACFDKDSSVATDGNACADLGSLITFDIPGLKVTEAVSSDLPSEAKRRRMLLETQTNTSNLSSRSESPLSLDSSRSETPTGTLTRAERQNELWRAIGSIDTFLMDKDIVEACKSTESDLSCEDDDFAGAPNVSFAEFLQQYRELTDWLNQVHKVTQREVTSLSEKYLNQSYQEEMLERSPRREFLNSYSRQLLLRYPNMAEQISARMTRLNTQWSALEQTIAPKHGRHDADTMLQDLECDLRTLKRWLNTIEARLLPLTISVDWTDTELEERLQRHQALQRDIESHNKIVNAVLKLSERLERDSQACGGPGNRDSLQQARNLERRWHGIWLQSLEWQCRLEEAIARRKGPVHSGYDFNRFPLLVLDESLFSNSAQDLSDQSLIELDDDSLLFIGHRNDYPDSTGTSTDEECKSYELAIGGRPASATSESYLFYIDSEAESNSDQESVVFTSYAGRSSRSSLDTPGPQSPSRTSAFVKPDSPLGKRPFPDFTSGEASPAKRGSQSPSSSSGGLSPVVPGSPLDLFITSRGLCINGRRGLVIESLYEDNDHTFLRAQSSLLDRSSGDSANISETESKMGDSPPSNNLLADSPEHLGGYVITSSDGEEDVLVRRSGSKAEIKDIGYSSESQSNDEVEVIHHQIDMEYRFPGKCEVASDSSLGDTVSLPSLLIKPDYYCMTLVDIDSTDKTDNGDTTDSGGEKSQEECTQNEVLVIRNVVQSDIIKTCSAGNQSDLKIFNNADSLEDSWEDSNFPSAVLLNEHGNERRFLHQDLPNQLLIEDSCDRLAPMHEHLEFSESDSAPESREKKSIRYLIEHAEDLVKPASPKHSSPSSPVKLQQTVTSPSKHTQTDSCSTVESSCDASGEDNSECEGLKAGSAGEGFSTATDDADETLFNSMINLESATESLKNGSISDVVFSSPTSSQVYDSPRLRKQTGGNPQQRGKKDRPWSVVGIENTGSPKKIDNFHQVVAASESAIDHLYFHTDTDSPSHLFTSSHFSTFPRDNHTGNIRRAFSSCDHTATKSAKRSLKYPLITTAATVITNTRSQHEDPMSEGSTISISNSPVSTSSSTKLPHSDASSQMSPRKSHRSRRLRRRSSWEKNAVTAAGSSSTTDSYMSAEAESESEPTDEYLTAPLEMATSDVDDIHNISGSLSENSSWDNYQMLYPTASEDPGEELLRWEPQDDLEFDDDFVLSRQTRSLVTDVMSSSQQLSKIKFTKQGIPCDDSDSDIEDFHYILDQAELALRVSSQFLGKKRKNSMGTGLHPNPAKYAEIIRTYETNKSCLESICQHLKSEDVPEHDVKRVQDIMYQWEKLYALASERLQQAKFLTGVVETMSSMQALVKDAEGYLSFDRFSSADELTRTISQLKEKHVVLEQQEQQLEEMSRQLKEFSTRYPTICVDKLMKELVSFKTSSTSMALKVSEHMRQLENNQAVWLEYLAEQRELDTFLATDRERLYKLLSQQEYGVRITKKDVLRELETLQSNLSIYETKLSTLQCMWTCLTRATDHSAQQLLLASLADLRNQLFVVSERCRQIYHDIEDDVNIPRDQPTDFGSLTMSAAALHEVFRKPKGEKSEKSVLEGDITSPHASTGITRSCASWLRSLPVQVVALMLVTGLVCALDPDILKRLTNFTLTINPELSYVNGPPAI